MKKEEQSFGCGISMSQKGHALSGWILRIVPLFAMLFATVVAKAAGDGDGVKFNPGVRYSQWAINSRAHDFYANTTAFGLAKYKADGTSVEIKRKDSKKKLDYVPGLVAKSMIEAADYYQNFDWSKPWFASVKEYGDAYYNSVPNGGGSLDDLNAVKLYIGIYNYKNATETDKKNAKTAIGRATEGLIAHNNSYSIQSGTLAGDAVVGGWFHKTAYNNQMWLDGAYMGSALLAQIVNFNGNGSNVFGSANDDWNMVFKQLNIVWNMCWNSTDKLMYHAFEANAGTGTSKSHADTWAGLNGTTKPYTFHSAAYWGRANAWYIFALVDALEAMGKAGRTSDTNYTTLRNHLQDLAAGIVARQTSDGGWYQLLDKTDSFEATSYSSSWSGKPKSATNYIETSATAIFSAALFKAARLGLIDAKYKENAKKAFECLVNNYTYQKDGSLEIWGSCRSAGLGGGTDKKYAAGGEKYRDGSNEYYLLGYDVPMVKKTDNLTEGKVLGGFIMAATEYERAYQNQDGSAQILFSYDL
ncbi:MAG: glycoside hydrolase family 88 protein, partial [Prevotella pectinovora]